MALVAISNLTKISPLSGNSVFPIVQDGTTYSAEVSSVNNLNTLQSVTDVGNTTTNSILIASLTAVGKIIGGNNNTANGADAAVLGGGDNTASGGSSTVTGGRCNTACADHSAILGGTTNTILPAHTDSFIIGSNITSSASATTFVNNLSAQGFVYGNTITANNQIFVGANTVVQNISGVDGIQRLTQTQYNNIITPDVDTLYVIVG